VVNARQKGTRYEREICKQLSEHFPGKFERRSMGIQGADVICSDDGFEYAVECKHQKGVRALHMFMGNHQITKWWQQAREQAGKVNKKPLLIAKIERHNFCTEDGIEWIYFESWCNLNRKNKISTSHK
jgi:Holliday junction resolvase